MSTGSEMLLERVRAATADEYDIEREIGLGGMAAVFLARDIALDRHVAIKVMRPDLIGVERIQDRFVSEARTAARLDHPGIVSVYAVKQRAGLLFIVMKYIEGHTLEGVLRASQLLDPATTAAIVGPVADALHFAHGAGIVHRDVKPSNILIDTRGRAVVTDFGIARVMAAESFTVAGSMLGTPSYMSPEQCRGLPATAASDQYSLGVTMYEMLTGRVPFTGGLFEVLDAHRDQLPPPIGQFVSGVDPALEATVMRMLAKRPEDRWGSLTDVVQRLTASTTSRRRDEEVRSALAFVATAPSAAPAAATPPPAAAVDGPPPLYELALTRTPTPAEPLGETWLAAAEPDAVVARSQPGTLPSEAELPRPKSRGLLIGGGAALLLAVAVFLALWMNRESGGEAAAIRPESLRRADTSVRQATPPVMAAPTRDSAAALAPSTSARDSATAPAPPPVVEAPKVRLPAPVQSSKAVAPQPTESLTVQCARLLERVSLGEKLTESERALLRRSCNR